MVSNVTLDSEREQYAKFADYETAKQFFLVTLIGRLKLKYTFGTFRGVLRVCGLGRSSYFCFV